MVYFFGSRHIAGYGDCPQDSITSHPYKTHFICQTFYFVCLFLPLSVYLLQGYLCVPTWNILTFAGFRFFSFTVFYGLLYVTVEFIQMPGSQNTTGQIKVIAIYQKQRWGWSQTNPGWATEPIRCSWENQPAFMVAKIRMSDASELSSAQHCKNPDRAWNIWNAI